MLCKFDRKVNAEVLMKCNILPVLFSCIVLLLLSSLEGVVDHIEGLMRLL